METNLQQQYEQVEKITGEYRAFIRKAVWRVLRPAIYFRLIVLFLKTYANNSGAVTRANKKHALIQQMTEIVYTATERTSPFYDIGVGPHSLHKLSCYIQQIYPDIAYAHLIKMHEISDIRIKGGNPAKLFGVVLAGGSLFLKTVPQAVVESFNINYANYQITTFWVIVVALAYIAILIAVWYSSTYRRNQVSKLAKEVIDYTAARIKAQAPDKS